MEAENARVAWMVTERPWELEEQLIASLTLPLNLDQNATLTALRRPARIRASSRAVGHATSRENQT